jgi:hypothetical protein
LGFDFIRPNSGVYNGKNSYVHFLAANASNCRIGMAYSTSYRFILGVDVEEDIPDNYVEILLQEFNVSEEDDLDAELERQSLTIPCLNCLRERPIEQIRFIDDDPYCIYCL